MNTNKLIVNLSVVAVSATVGLLAAEFAARLILHPADYLSVELVSDPVLGMVPSSNTRASGFDDWGFRNRAVPKTADIVAIGDSHTYGNTARMEDSWPYVLGRLTGRSVYNLALGGYGPNQYFELLKTRALTLHPTLIVCGLYLGDDFENAFLMSYGLEHWSYLRELPAEKVNFDIWEAPPALTWHKKIRLWLSRHSVVYQLLAHASVLGRFQGEVQIANARQLSDAAVSLIIPDRHIMEAFRPRGILQRLDQKNPSVREGMRITFKLLAEMNEICRRNGVQFLVVVIPPKEMVFSDYLEHDPKLPLSDVLDGVLANGRLARASTLAFLAKSDIQYVDALPALTQSREQELYARSAADMHPNMNGYRVIGEAVSQALKETHVSQ